MTTPIHYTAEFDHQLTLPSSIARTPKNANNPYTRINNGLLRINLKMSDLKPVDIHVMTRVLTLPDDWEFMNFPKWVMSELGVSRATAYRIVARLREAGLMAPVFNTKVWRRGWQAFEIPCEDRPRGDEARKVHCVNARKSCYGNYRMAPDVKKQHHGYLEVRNPEPAFLGRKRGVSRLRHIQRTKDVLHTSEHPSTLKLPSREPGFEDDLRDGRSTIRVRRTVQRAKRGQPGGNPATHANRKRSSRERQHHSSNPKSGKQVSRAEFNAVGFTAKADTEAFLNDLAEALPAAREHIVENSNLTIKGAREELEQNPIIALAQQLLTKGLPWNRAQVRKFAARGCTYAYDIALLGHAQRCGWLTPADSWQVAEQHRRSEDHRVRLDSPTLSKGTCMNLDFMGWDENVFDWHRVIDQYRQTIHQAAVRPLKNLIESLRVPLGPNAGEDELVASMRCSRVYWTLVKELGFHDDDPTIRALMERVIRPVSSRVLRRLLNAGAPEVPGGWHFSWVLQGPVSEPIRNAAIALGRLLGQNELPPELVSFSVYRLENYARPLQPRA